MWVFLLLIHFDLSRGRSNEANRSTFITQDSTAHPKTLRLAACLGPHLDPAGHGKLEQQWAENGIHELDLIILSHDCLAHTWNMILGKKVIWRSKWFNQSICDLNLLYEHVAFSQVMDFFGQLFWGCITETLVFTRETWYFLLCCREMPSQLSIIVFISVHIFEATPPSHHRSESVCVFGDFHSAFLFHSDDGFSTWWYFRHGIPSKHSSFAMGSNDSLPTLWICFWITFASQG